MDVCPPTAALSKTNIPSAPKKWCSPIGISISRVSSFRGELLVSGRVQSANLGDFRWIMGGSPEPHESRMFGVTKPCSDSSSIGQSGSIYIPWDIFINLPCKVSTNKWHLISNQSRCHIIVIHWEAKQPKLRSASCNFIICFKYTRNVLKHDVLLLMVQKSGKLTSWQVVEIPLQGDGYIPGPGLGISPTSGRMIPGKAP